jgi:hypothetical protein
VAHTHHAARSPSPKASIVRRRRKPALQCFSSARAGPRCPLPCQAGGGFTGGGDGCVCPRSGPEVRPRGRGRAPAVGGGRHRQKGAADRHLKKKTGQRRRRGSGHARSRSPRLPRFHAHQHTFVPLVRKQNSFPSRQKDTAKPSCAPLRPSPGRPLPRSLPWLARASVSFGWRGRGRREYSPLRRAWPVRLFFPSRPLTPLSRPPPSTPQPAVAAPSPGRPPLCALSPAKMTR